MTDQLRQSERSPDAAGRVTAIMVALWLITSVTFLRAPVSAAADPQTPIGLRSVDPNSAPWWELTVLPRIGETIARRIVGFRTSSAVDRLSEPDSPNESDPRPDEYTFSKPADLARVRGIGPKTVERIAPWLRFEQITSATEN